MLIRYKFVPAAVGCMVLAACAGSRSEPPPDPRKDAAFRPFLKNLREYGRVHEAAQFGMPDLKTTSEPQEIEAHSLKIAGAIRSARANARPGDVFSVSQPHFVQVIRTELRGPSGKTALRAIEKEDPAKEQNVDLRINGTYPSDAPRSTVPPALLARLPALPKYLEYRFVGPNLILLDTGANLIVDYIENAIT